MIFIVSIGVYMVYRDTDSLLEDDYYERGLHYDEVYRRKQSLVDDDAKPMLKLERDTLFITFKQFGNAGEALLRRPSDGKLDLKIPFATKTNVYAVPVATLLKGNWSLELAWESDGKPYLDTRPLFIQ